MKKAICLVLAALLTLGLTACGKQQAVEPGGSLAPEQPGMTAELDAIYRHSALGNYADIRDLDAEYSSEQAAADGCFVIAPLERSNEDLYTDFMQRFQNQEDAFIRVTQTTVEGDLILTDVLYDSQTNCVYLVHDATRDAFSAASDRVITLRTYTSTGQYDLDGDLYWIAYNGDLADVDLRNEFSLDQVFVIAGIH